MDATQLREQIAESKLLTDLERAFWLENVETLTPEQYEKLTTVLNKAAQLTWTDQMNTYMDIVRRGQQSLTPPA